MALFVGEEVNIIANLVNVIVMFANKCHWLLLLILLQSLISFY